MPQSRDMKTLEIEDEVAEKHPPRSPHLHLRCRVTECTPTTYKGKVYTCVYHCVPTCTLLYTHVYTTSL